jgi:tRNA(fMet)-specific endonuclease VapC
MSGRYLLDTNIIIDLLANEEVVRTMLLEAEEAFVSSIAIGELYYGAEKSTRPAENSSRIDEFAGIATVLGCDSQTARHYGQIKNMLRAKGRPIPENDLWIAAVARQHALTLVTRDKHFNEIEDLTTVCW